jgi:hypothetical protein
MRQDLSMGLLMVILLPVVVIGFICVLLLGLVDEIREGLRER